VVISWDFNGDLMKLCGDFMGLCGDFMGLCGDFIGFSWGLKQEI